MTHAITDHKKTPIPKIYDTSDLDELNTFCWEPHVSSLDLPELVKTQAGIDKIFSSCNYDSLLASLARMPGADLSKTAIVWSSNHLRRMAVDGEGMDGLSYLFFIHGEQGLSGDDKAYIQQITDKYKVRVMVKRATFSSVATEGQWRYFSDVYHKDNSGWHFMVVADNHDLYQIHYDESLYWPHCHLIIPKSAPRLKPVMTDRASHQAQIDAKRHEHLMWAFVAYRNNCKVMGRIIEELPAHNPMPARASV